MILFLIGLFVLGVLFVNLFHGHLPDLFLAITAPLIGLIVYVVNVVFLLLLHISVNLTAVAVMLIIELILLTVFKFIILKKKIKLNELIYKLELAVGVVYFAAILLFTNLVIVFGSNDSVYMVVMAQNILKTGLMKWYFASPAGMGIFVPIIQTLGMLFNNSYSWFIQPIISLLFLAFFAYFSFTALKKHKMPIWIILSLLAVFFWVMLSSNLFLITTAYIHTNFDSGFFIFLSFATLLRYREDKNQNWLIFCTIFLTTLGLMRVENILFILIFIVLFIMDGNIARRQMLKTFVPTLVLLFLWYVVILTMKTNSFTDQMSSEMIMLVLVMIIFVIVLLALSDLKPIKKLFTEGLPRVFLIGLTAVVVLLIAVQPDNSLANIQVILTNMFITGSWGSLWWFVAILTIVLAASGPKIPDEKLFVYLITTFFVLILLLGSFRKPYHLQYPDSANRMYFHILPIILFYQLEKIGSWYEQVKATAPAPAKLPK